MATLTINGTTYTGICLDDEAIGNFLTPPPLKPRVESKSRLADGKRVVVNDTPRVDSCEFTLPITIYGADKTEFLSRYNTLLGILHTGLVSITIDGVTRNCTYLSCQQFSQFMHGIGKFVLRLEEYKPTR